MNGNSAYTILQGEIDELSSSIADKQPAYNKGWTHVVREITEDDMTDEPLTKVEFQLPTDKDVSEVVVSVGAKIESVGTNYAFYISVGNGSSANGQVLMSWNINSTSEFSVRAVIEKIIYDSERAQTLCHYSTYKGASTIQLISDVSHGKSLASEGYIPHKGATLNVVYSNGFLAGTKIYVNYR